MSSFLGDEIRHQGVELRLGVPGILGMFWANAGPPTRIPANAITATVFILTPLFVEQALVVAVRP
jgi:hypothetical protein